MSSFTSALSFQPVPSSVGPASPASSVGMRFGLRVAPSHKDGALRAELPAGRIHQPGHRLAAQHWVRHLFFLWLATCQSSLRETKLYICIYLFASLSVSIETSSEWAWPSQGTRRRYSPPSRRSGYTKLHPPCSTDQSQPGHSTTLKMTLTLSTVVPDPANGNALQPETLTDAVSTNQNEGMRWLFFDGLVEPQDFYWLVSLNHISRLLVFLNPLWTAELTEISQSASSTERMLEDFGNYSLCGLFWLDVPPL